MLDKDRFASVLLQASQEVGVSLTTSEVELFWIYLQELGDWNKKFNLTAIRDPEDIIIKHFVDSLTPLPYMTRSGGLMDVGSGAGFPGIPLKIAAPQLQVSLVDSSRRRVSFMKHIIRMLGLEGITVLHSRLEDIDQPPEPFESIISRAFRQLETLLHLVTPLLQPGNRLVAMIGPAAPEEQKRFGALASERNLELNRTVSLELPRNQGRRTLLFFQKR
jgi:16S rRNA (guanine527-N7)-methyltransferase